MSYIILMDSCGDCSEELKASGRLASIPLRIPSAAPEIAKAGIPVSSRMNISVSNAYHSPPCFAREVYHFWGFISSRKRPRRWRPGRRACR